MCKHFLFAGILLLALLSGAWGKVLAVAMCPRMGQEHACCRARVAHHHASHHEMAGMQMGDEQSKPVAEQKTDANAFSQPVEACAHCLEHSQLPASPTTLREAEQSKRGTEVTPTLPPARPATVVAPFTGTILAREHAPPGVASSARHVFISVFRI